MTAFEANGIRESTLRRLRCRGFVNPGHPQSKGSIKLNSKELNIFPAYFYSTPEYRKAVESG
jgi:hypothetical protein